MYVSDILSETYKGNTLTWKNGRELATYGNYSFTYDANGIRIGKTNGTTVTNYIVDGSTVLRQSWISGSNSYVADYIYSESGTPLAFALSTNGGDYVYYFYETNIQGDVIAIYNSSWTKLAAFYYDAWGKFTEGVFNTTGYTSAVRQGSLFRYRGYIYDTETQLYYLQSRYYDPAVGRFINADSAIYYGLLGTNLYSYCENNPVNYHDPYGESAEALLAGWLSSAWGLTLVDGLLPIGDIIFGTVASILLIATVIEVAEEIEETVYEAKNKEKKKKKAKKSGKEKADDNPSWTNPDMINKNQSAQENAERMMNEKYGNGNWSRKSSNPNRPGRYSDYSKIVKWIERGGYLSAIGIMIDKENPDAIFVFY